MSDKGRAMMMESGWVAVVARNHMRLQDSVEIALGRRGNDGRIAEIAKPIEIQVQEYDDATAAEPWLRLPENVARALLDALALHFGGTSDLRQLRADYDAERKRVDKLLDRMVVDQAWRPAA